MTQQTTATLTFVVGEMGLDTRLSTIYDTEAEFFQDDPPANHSWTHVTVASEADREAWIAAKNRWLAAAWTPNQTREEREENARIEREAEAEMSRLALEVR